MLYDSHIGNIQKDHESDDIHSEQTNTSVEFIQDSKNSFETSQDIETIELSSDEDCY